MTHICVGKQTSIGSDNGLSPGRRLAIIWTNAGILLIEPLGTNFSEISIKILTFSFTKMRLKVSSAKWRPFCLGLNVLTRKVYPCRDVIACYNFAVCLLNIWPYRSLWICLRKRYQTTKYSAVPEKVLCCFKVSERLEMQFKWGLLMKY